MKKILLSVLAVFLLVPVAMFADSWTKTVTDKATFDAALKTIGAGVAGDTYTVICDWGNDVVVAASRFSSTMTAGTLVVKSNQTDYTKMPTLQWQFQQTVNADSLSTDAISLILENLHLYNTNDIVTFRQNITHIDTFAILNCDVDAGTGGTRTVFRGDGGSSTDLVARLSYIKTFIVKDSKFHGYNQVAANNWSTFRPFMPVLRIEAVNNMFYNFPFSKGIFECRYPGQQPANIYFNNNAVICARANAYTGGTTYTPLSFGGNFAEGSNLYVCNNIFMAPIKGSGSVVGREITVITKRMVDSVEVSDTIVRPFEASDYKETEFTNLSNKALIYAFGNIIDTLSYKSLEAMDSTLLKKTSKLEYKDEGVNPNTTLDSYTGFSWEEGKWFQDPAADMYFVLKNSPWITAGYNVSEENDYADWGKPTHVGPTWMYVDDFPQAVSVNVTVNGPSFCSYAISPVKLQYYTGDEVKVSVSDKNNYYRTFTTFDGWVGVPTGVDASAKEFTFKLTGDVNLIATYTSVVNPIAAFQVSADPKSTELKAEIYNNMDVAYQATAYYFKNDTLPGGVQLTSSYVNHVFRGSKFSDSEEAPELHQSTTRASTMPVAKAAGKRDMIIIKACTKGFKNVKAAALVGTDNNMSRKALCLYSLDGVDFTTCGEVSVPDALKWAEVEGTLPEACNDKDSVFIAFQEDPAAKTFADYIYNPEAFKLDGAYLTGAELEAKVLADATFMYVGNILITGEVVSGIDNVRVNNKGNKATGIYNLAGQKVSEDYRGIILKNGIKILNK